METQRPSLGFWLWLLTLVLAVGPLFGLAATYETLQQSVQMAPELAADSPWQSYVMFTSLLSLGILAGYWYGIHLIANGRHRGHIQRLIIILWCFGPGMRILEIVVAGILFGSEQFNAALTAPHVLGPLGAHGVLALVWTLYLNSSERVAARYPVRTVAAAAMG
jgi:hypothetical protein